MKDRIIVITFFIFVSIFSISHIMLKDELISTIERRELSTFPEYKLDNNYINNVEKYILDHFPLRDSFRNIKANYNNNVLGMLDNNGIFILNDYIFKSNYPTSKDSINNFINKTNSIINIFKNNNKFIMVIPDKNYFINNNDYLKIDYDCLYAEIAKLNLNNIEVKDVLSINDYYETDTHWKQENLDKVIKRMSNKMNFNYENIYYTKNIYNNFYGVYYNESGIKRNPETITYLTNSIIDLVNVNYLENKNLNKVYNKNKLIGLDSYEIYLDGASSYIEITNNYSNNEKELIVFRDSFGSSLVPLLINYYKKITVIDNRYINSDNFLNYIELKDQEILFIYSTLLINNSYSLKG